MIVPSPNGTGAVLDPDTARWLALANQHRAAPPVAPTPAPAPQPSGLQLHSDLLAKVWPPERMLVADLLGAGETAIVAADPNVGKSWFALELGRCVAAGLDFLGRFPTAAGPVAYLDEESAERPMTARLKMLDRENPIGEAPFWLGSNLGARIDTEQGIRDLERRLAPYEPTLLIFDSLTRVHSVNESAAGEMARVLGNARGLGARLGAAVVFVHHLRKKSLAGSNDPGERLRGSGDIRAWADVVLVMEEVADDPRSMVVETRKQRNRDRLAPFTVRREIDPEAGTARLIHDGEPPADTRASGSDLIEAINAITQKDGPDQCDRQTLAGFLGVAPVTVGRAADRLLKIGLIEERRVKTTSGPGRGKVVYGIPSREPKELFSFTSPPMEWSE